MQKTLAKKEDIRLMFFAISDFWVKMKLAPFWPRFPFYAPWKHHIKLWFSDVLTGYKMDIWAKNGLNEFSTSDLSFGLDQHEFKVYHFFIWIIFKYFHVHESSNTRSEKYTFRNYIFSGSELRNIVSWKN